MGKIFLANPASFCMEQDLRLNFFLANPASFCMEQDLRVNVFSQIPPTSCRAGFGTLLRSGLSSSPGTYQCPRRMMYAGTILSALCRGTYEAAEPLCVVCLRAEGSMCSYCVVCSYYEAYGIEYSSI